MKTKAEKIEEFLRGLECDIDIMDYVDAETVESYDDILSQIEDSNGFDVEIIYYSRAMEYLSENDPSLYECMEIASEYGFGPESLTSETLASLLASKNARESFYELENEITEFFDELEDDEEEEDEEDEEETEDES